MKFQDLINKYPDRNFMVIGTGKSLITHLPKILQFIKDHNVITIAINNIPPEIHPDFHLWTNNQRFSKYGKITNPNLGIMIGAHIQAKFLAKNKIKKFIKIPCHDRDQNEPIVFKKGKMRGYYKTAGNQAILISHILGAKQVYVVGMDGFALNFDGGTHYYKDGKEELKTLKDWKQRDAIVAKALKELHTITKFKIITPTIHESYYDKKIL